ncbi:hypothetical protein BD626DRAFT_484097 [Schizophyllum amplum]|uniref:Uncharacterized protein n=1 Tax=Schizophyllum amplum TaxID=97359 RepID=A0A550CPZ8_9AGAR|nr:hypothetical protein BD626DRAFT_484097 [Auriculariopsis ampla]
MSAVIINFRAPENHPIRRLPSAFTLPFSGMLTARFILHLRARVGEDVVKTDAGRTSMTVSRLAFGPPADADSSQGATESTFVSTWEAPMDVENRALVFALSPLSSGTASTSGQTTTFVSERPPRRDHGQKGKGRAR